MSNISGALYKVNIITTNERKCNLITVNVTPVSVQKAMSSSGGGRIEVMARA